MFGWIFKKKEVASIKKETKQGFESVKKDMNSIGEWIKHLNSEKDSQKEELREVKEILSSINEEIEGIKNIVSIMGEIKKPGLFEKNKQLFKQQTAVYAVQTAVQTGVQTPNLGLFSLTERAIIWVLLNTDMKLSFEDIGSILGKEKATIRGQINHIKQKSEVIEEIIEKNGKKRVFIPENIKKIMLKKAKVRVEDKGKAKKTKKAVKKALKVNSKAKK
jgi:chromosome segregation protein